MQSSELTHEHWATLLYAEDCAVNHGGVLDGKKMRPWDWSNLGDLRTCRLVDESVIRGNVHLTEAGWAIAHQARRYMGDHQNLINFITALPLPGATPTEWVYGCRNRPPMYGTVPEGYTSVGEDTRYTLPQHPYGVVRYNRPLTPREIYKFELLPMSPLPTLPLYPPGRIVRNMNTGKTHVVEEYDGGYVIGDHAMVLLRDWLVYEPAELVG